MNKKMKKNYYIDFAFNREDHEWDSQMRSIRGLKLESDCKLEIVKWIDV